MVVDDDTATPIKAPRTRKDKKEKKGKERTDEKEASKDKEIIIDDPSPEKTLRQKVKVRR